MDISPRTEAASSAPMRTQICFSSSGDRDFFFVLPDFRTVPMSGVSTSTNTWDRIVVLGRDEQGEMSFLGCSSLLLQYFDSDASTRLPYP